VADWQLTAGNARYDPFHLWIKSMAGRSVWSIVNTCPAAVFYG